MICAQTGERMRDRRENARGDRRIERVESCELSDETAPYRKTYDCVTIPLARVNFDTSLLAGIHSDFSETTIALTG
jgi:hypothetical protein